MVLRFIVSADVVSSLKSRRELGLSLGVLKSGDSWGLSIRLEVEVCGCDNAWSEIRVDGASHVSN